MARVAVFLSFFTLTETFVMFPRSEIIKKNFAYCKDYWSRNRFLDRRQDTIYRSRTAKKQESALQLQCSTSRETGYIHFDSEKTLASNFNPVTSTDDYTEIEECSKFFVDSFWLQGTTLGTLHINSYQRKELEQQQYRDLSERYGRLVGKRKLESSLLIARDESGAIEGCVGIEIAVADATSRTVLSR